MTNHIGNEVGEKVIAMYQKGMTTRDIHDHLQDIYGVEVSAGMVSIIIDRVIPRIHEWQNRPLEAKGKRNFWESGLGKIEDKWPELATFFQFPEEVRTIIYTTNSVESLHRQQRKATKTTSLFPHDEELMKLLWLAQEDFTKKWTAPIPN